MRYLENLSQQNLEDGPFPWDFKAGVPIPDDVRTDKKKRDAWINNPGTRHYVYTFCCGVNTSVRISAPKADEGGNPVLTCHAIVADYDARGSLESVKEQLRSLPFQPNWLERTLSGHWRALWLLEEPLVFASHSFFKHFTQTFESFAFRISLGWVGFDRGAFEAPERLYTTSCDWHHIHDSKIPADVSRGWLVVASKKFTFDKSEFGGLLIPLDVVASKLRELFPRFEIEWTVPFEVGQQGPSFFVEGSTSPKSAIIHGTGIQTFSAHAVRGFFKWSDLLGIDFCKSYEAKEIGRAVKEIYHDGKHYHRQLPNLCWKGFEKADIINHLITARGVSVAPPKKGCASQLQECIEYIHSYQSVIGAAPFIYRPSGLIRCDGSPYLNISSLKVMQPSEMGVWGLNGNFPWLSNFFDNFFSSDEQHPHFQAWAAHGYQGALMMEPVSGQACFVVGPPGTGKTLLSRGILGPIFGGSVDATRYYMGQDNFGSQIFDRGFHVIDDAIISTDPKAHKHFTEAIKKAVANREQEYHPKFRIASMVIWLGRVFVTCNSDVVSVRIIPNLDQSIIDKLMIFKTREKTVKFPKAKELAEILNYEIPNYCAWLRDHKIPDELVGDSRFGIKCYHEPSLVRSSIQSSENAGFGEILDDWKQWYFQNTPEASYWKGNSFQLLKALVRDEATEKTVIRKLTVESVNRHLAGLMNKGANIRCDDSGETRVWKIYRDKNAMAADIQRLASNTFLTTAV